MRAFLSRSPVDRHGRPIPWVTYPYLDFLDPRLNSTMSVFEYGCGNSTLYFSDRVSSVRSVEHDQAFYERMREQAASNVEIIFAPDVHDGSYTAACRDGEYDLVVVDGRNRSQCMVDAVTGLSSRGVIILDDSDRVEYKSGSDFLGEHGFRKIDFWGIGVGLFYKKCTSVFYRDGNCLGI